MKSLLQRFTRVGRAGASTGAPVQVELAAFGKHRGWNDYMSIGGVTEGLAEFKATLVDGIRFQMETGEWARLDAGRLLEGFAHSFARFCAPRLLIGRMWSSSDGTREKRAFPMVVCVEYEGGSARSGLERSAEVLRRLEDACQASPEASGVEQACAAALVELRGAAQGRPEDGSAPVIDSGRRERLLRSAALGPNREGLLRVLHELSSKLGLPADDLYRGGVFSGSAFVRLPVGIDPPEEAILLWHDLLRPLISDRIPMLFCHRREACWIDLLVGSPSPEDFYFLRASAEALPPASDIDYGWADALEGQADRLVASFLGAPPPAEDDPRVQAPEASSLPDAPAVPTPPSGAGVRVNSQRPLADRKVAGGVLGAVALLALAGFFLIPSISKPRVSATDAGSVKTPASAAGTEVAGGPVAVSSDGPRMSPSLPETASVIVFRGAAGTVSPEPTARSGESESPPTAPIVREEPSVPTGGGPARALPDGPAEPANPGSDRGLVEPVILPPAADSDPPAGVSALPEPGPGASPLSTTPLAPRIVTDDSAADAAPRVKEEDVAPPEYTNRFGMRFVRLRGGPRGLLVGEAEVTVSQFVGVLGRLEAGDGGRDHLPIILAYEDAVRFCQELSRIEKKTYDLPSKEEWLAFAGLAPDEVPRAWEVLRERGALDFEVVGLDEAAARRRDTPEIRGTQGRQTNGLQDLLGNLREWLSTGESAGFAFDAAHEGRYSRALFSAEPRPYFRRTTGFRCVLRLAGTPTVNSP